MGDRNQKGRLTLKGCTVKWIRDLKRPIAVEGSQSACVTWARQERETGTWTGMAL